jgi:hypothetical protein
MSGNIKFIGEDSSETVQLPTSGRGGFFGKQSNTKGADEALIKFANSFTEPKTMAQMMAAFPNLGTQIPNKEIEKSQRLTMLKNLLTVTPKPKDDEDCSIFIVEKKKVKPIFARTGIGTETEFVLPSDEELINQYKTMPKNMPESKIPSMGMLQRLTEQERQSRAQLLERNNMFSEDPYENRLKDEELKRGMMSNEDANANNNLAGGKSRRRRRRSSKKARRSTNKKRNSRRGKRKSYKR